MTKEERAAARTTRENAERERHAEFVLAFSRLQDLDEAVNSGDDDAITRWLEIASVLVDSFRSTRQLFPGDFRRKFTGVVSSFAGRRGRRTQAQRLDAEADQMANRLERTMSKGSAFTDVTASTVTDLDLLSQSRRKTTRSKSTPSGAYISTNGSNLSCG